MGREHRQHLLLEAGIAERHAFEMFEIDRTVIGASGGDGTSQSVRDEAAWPNPDPCRIVSGSICASQSRNWLTERWRICRNFALFLTKSCHGQPLPTGNLSTRKVLSHKAVNDD